MKKLILILLLGALVLLTLWGCNQSNNDEGTSPENTTDSTAPDNIADTKAREDNVIPAPSEDDPFGGEKVSFSAGLFAQYVNLSWGYTLNITVDDGKIFLNDILYENAGTISNPTIVYNQALLQYFELEEDKEAESEEELKSLLMKVKELA